MKVTFDEFVRRANEKHNFKYSYDELTYTKLSNKLRIICPKHEDFYQEATSHLMGCGCPKCGFENNWKKRRPTKDDFVKKAVNKHGLKYNYDKVVYTKAINKIIITCPIHGDFNQTPNGHLNGRGCPKCGIELTNIKNKKNTEYFIKKGVEIYNGFYNYDKVIYVNNRSKVIITCPIHGDFSQNAGNHLNGFGCKKCGLITAILKITKSTKDFTKEAKIIHNGKYLYNNVNYTNANVKVSITCKIHGDFTQTPSSHLNGNGCPKCSMSGISKPETEISEMVRGLGYEVLNNTRTVIEPYELDIYIPKLNKAIEFNGLYWHYNEDKFRKGYHAMKSNMCREKGIQLLHVREELWLKNKENMLKIIKTFLEK